MQMKQAFFLGKYEVTLLTISGLINCSIFYYHTLPYYIFLKLV
jgi:hypothetical protein